MAADRVGVAIVGLGRWGITLARAAKRSGELDVMTGYAPSEEKRAAFADEFGCETASSLEGVFASKCDAVVIATPHRHHVEAVRSAAAAGKHILVEKPFTLTVQEARDAVEAVQAAGVVLQVGHQRRRSAALRGLRQLTDEGTLGVPVMFEAHLTASSGLSPGSGWKDERDERPLGGMTAFGVHMVDNLQYLIGPAKRVSAFSASLLDRTSLDDATQLLIEYERGPLAVVSTSLVTLNVGTLGMYGTEGAAWSHHDGERLLLQMREDSQPTEQFCEPVDVLAEQMAEFGRAARGEVEPEVGGVEGLEVVAVLEASILSAQRGCSIEMDEVR